MTAPVPRLGRAQRDTLRALAASADGLTQGDLLRSGVAAQPVLSSALWRLRELGLAVITGQQPAVRKDGSTAGKPRDVWNATEAGREHDRRTGGGR